MAKCWAGVPGFRCAQSGLQRLRHFPFWRRHFRDQPRPALEGEVVPEPIDGDDKSLAVSDQEEDVDRAPEQPADESTQLQSAKLHDRGVPSDGGEIALMAIAEWG